MSTYLDAVSNLITPPDIHVGRGRLQFFSSLREKGSIHHDAESGLYVVTKYDMQRHILRDHKTFTSEIGILFTRYKNSQNRREIESIYESQGCLPLDNLIFIDPPAHSKYRKPVQEAFLPKRLQHMRAYITEYSNYLIDQFIASGKCNYAEEFAIPLPVAVVARELGVPPSDYKIYRKWSDDIIEQVHPLLTPERELELVHSFVAMQQYFRVKIEDMIANPRDCLLSAMIHAPSGDGERLTVQEIISIVMILVLAGNETTGNSLGWAMWTLAQDPDLADRLRSGIDKNDEIDKFVEEALRLNPPAMLFRGVTEDTEIDGTPVPKGSIIHLPPLAGNHDAEAFPEPEKISLTRPNSHQHVTFGQGVHICLGMHLARMEMSIAIRETLRRMKNIRFDPDDHLQLNPGFGVWGLLKIPVLFDAN